MLFALAPIAVLLTGASAASSTTSSAASTASSTSTTSSCSDVHLFLARGNGEDYPGRVGAMGPAVCNGIASCDYENIIFTSNEVFCNAVSDGAAAGIAQMRAYATKCPKAKLVLAGYSLGGQIVGDILGGAGVQEYTCTEATSAALDRNTLPGNRLAAAAIFGDVRHVGGQVYNTGSGAAFDGQYPRSGEQLTAMNQYSDVLRSWCLSTDPICALGDDGLSHETYMTVFAADAGAWIQEQVLSFTIGESFTSVAPSTSATSASSSTSSSATAKSTSSGSSSSSSSSSSSTSATSTSSSISSTSRSLKTSFTPFVFPSTSFSSYTQSLTTTRSSTSSTSSIIFERPAATSAISTSSSKAVGTRPTPFVAQIFRMIAQR